MDNCINIRIFAAQNSIFIHYLCGGPTIKTKFNLKKA
nr:MAG TPA: hypothetical protein [Caudoviricetes sp.]